MKKAKKLYAVILSALMAVSICAASFSAYAEVIYKTNEDYSRTIITLKDPNRTIEYDITSDGGGKAVTTFTASYLVSADIEKSSSLPENVLIADRETIFQPPEINGEFLCFNDYEAIMTLKKAQKLAVLLNSAEGISNIHIHQKQTSTKCWLYENWYNAGGSYEFNVNDFSEIIEKGFEVSLHEYGYISITAPGSDTTSHASNYQGMLAAMEIQQSKGIELMPYINCLTSERASYSEYNIPGDLNSDFTVNIADLVSLQKIVTNKNDTENVINPSSADINNDNSVNVFDAAALRRKLLDI